MASSHEVPTVSSPSKPFRVQTPEERARRKSRKSVQVERGRLNTAIPRYESPAIVIPPKNNTLRGFDKSHSDPNFSHKRNNNEFDDINISKIDDIIHSSSHNTNHIHNGENNFVHSTTHYTPASNNTSNSTQTDDNSSTSPVNSGTSRDPYHPNRTAPQDLLKVLNSAKKSKSRATVTRPGTYKLVAEDADNPLWVYHSFKGQQQQEGTISPAPGTSPTSIGSPELSSSPKQVPSQPQTSSSPSTTQAASSPPANNSPINSQQPSPVSSPLGARHTTPVDNPAQEKPTSPIVPRGVPPKWTNAPGESVLVVPMPKQVTTQRKNSRAAMIDLRGPAAPKKTLAPVDLSDNINNNNDNNNKKMDKLKTTPLKNSGSMFKGEKDFKAYTSFLIANKEKTIAVRQSRIASWVDELDEIDKSVQKLVISEPESPDASKLEEMFPWFQNLLQDEQVRASVARRLSHIEEENDSTYGERIKVYVDTMPRPVPPASEVRRSEVKARSYTTANVSSVPIPNFLPSSPPAIPSPVSSSPPTNSPPTVPSPISSSPPTGSSPPTSAAEKNPSMGRKRVRKQTSFRTKMKHYNACYRASWLSYYERGLRPKWVRRWAVFSFEENKIGLFEDPKDKNPKSNVFLDEAVSVAKCDFQGKMNGFCVRAKRAHYFSADSPAEAKEWMNLVEFSLVFLDSKTLKQWMQLSQAEREAYYQKAHSSISEPFNVQHTANPIVNNNK